MAGGRVGAAGGRGVCLGQTRAPGRRAEARRHRLRRPRTRAAEKERESSARPRRKPRKQRE
eukprot:11290324-Heterocapsa_arctica.AAC.1